MKTLCKLKLKPKDELGRELRALLLPPKYYCRKCLRCAAEKNALCRPEKL